MAPVIRTFLSFRPHKAGQGLKVAQSHHRDAELAVRIIHEFIRDLVERERETGREFGPGYGRGVRAMSVGGTMLNAATAWLASESGCWEARGECDVNRGGGASHQEELKAQDESDGRHQDSRDLQPHVKVKDRS